MKISFNFGLFKKKLFDHINIIVYVLIIAVISGFLYFFYTQIYSVIINPKEIDKNVIIAKKQKVNLDLFGKVIDRIQKKIKQESMESEQNKDPFAPI